MPLETATFIKDLVASNPAHTDGLNQADSHMRLIKSTIEATFPNFISGPLQSTQAQLDGAVAVTTGASVNQFPLGAALLPGLTPVGDPDTGWWSPGANQLAFSIGGVQQASFTNGTNVFVGGIAASALLSVGAFSGGTGQLVPIGAVLEWYDDTLPVEGGYVWANGQIIASANTACPVLLARWGNKFGGNGVTTMGVPDRRNTVAVGKDTMGAIASRGLLANITTALITTLNSVFGLGTHTLTAAEIPPVAFSGTTGNDTPDHVHGGGAGTNAKAGVAAGSSFLAVQDVPIGNTGGASTRHQHPFSGAISGGGGAHDIVQPSTTCNFILRIA